MIHITKIFVSELKKTLQDSDFLLSTSPLA